MLRSHLRHLVCPTCRSSLGLLNEGERIETGTLKCEQGHIFPITGGIPRFVPTENYAASFGIEWTKHAATQYDNQAGVPLSETRFFEETGWPRQMEGEVIIDAGCGSGRFTEQAAWTGATVLAFDYSVAVDASYRENGAKSNVLIVQADIYHMPFPDHVADRLFCLGVLQHTPDPRKALAGLPRVVKPGGPVVADIYRKSLRRIVLPPKYLVRPFTRRMDPQRLYRLVRRYVDLMWPLTATIRKIPRYGPTINWCLLVADYSREGVPTNVLKDWAYLDTFDMLSPQHDHPQTRRTVETWISELGLNGDVRYGYNGIEIHLTS